MNYSDKLEIIKSLNTPINTSMRYNCPFCGGSNSLGVANRHGKLLWRCFRDSCGVKGKAEVTMTASQLLAKAPPPQTKFILPPHITYVSNPEALSWLAKWHCTWAISKGYAEVRYDPREHRVVFLIRDKDGEIVDAAGRALHYGGKPKWRKYGNSGLPLIIGKGDTCYLCEDAASACALSHFGAGVALLGTHVSSAIATSLRAFQRCVVCLDPDAKLKALAIQKRVSCYIPTSVVFLQEDPKAYSEAELKELLGFNKNSTIRPN